MINRIINNIVKDKKTFWDIIFILGCEIFSALCAFTTNNIFLTLLYIIITTVFSICAKIYSDINLEKGLDFLMNINRKAIYYVLIIIAFLPIIIGRITNEIEFKSVFGFIEKMFSNPIPNFFGALIVCSIIKHLSKFNTKETMSSIIKSKKDFFDVIVRFSFMGAFLNALNYKIDEDLVFTNAFNGIHLFIVIFLGIILMSVFALRLIDEEPFPFTASQIYPMWTLLFSSLFIGSCGFSPLFWGDAKHEVVLLTFITLIALLVTWFFVYIIKNKTKKRSGLYPLWKPILFSFIVIANLIINIYWEKINLDKKTQLISGFCILIAVIVLIIYIDKQDGSREIE